MTTLARIPRLAANSVAASVLAMTMVAGGTAIAAAQSGVDMLPPEVLEAAQEEGGLTVYAAQSQKLIEQTASAFEEAFPGIEVSIIRAASSTLANRYMSEVDAGVREADVLNSANTGIYTDNPDMWMELTPELIPTLAEWPEAEIHGIYLNSSQGPQTIAYNTNLVSEENAPQTWEDLLDPVYQGNCLMVDPRSSNTYLNWANLMYDEYGPQFLEQLRSQKCVLVEGGSQGAQQVAAGAAMVEFPPSFAHVEPLIDQGAPLGYVYPPENSDVPAMGPQHSWGIPAQAPHPNAARVFMTWLLTDAAQEINCGGNAASVKLPDSDVCPAPFENFISADQTIPEERREEVLTLLGLQ